MLAHVVILTEYLIEYLVCLEVRLMYAEWWTMMVITVTSIVTVVTAVAWAVSVPSQ